MSQVLGFRELGLADYEPTWQAMQRFTDERKRKEIEALTIKRNEIAREITRFLREAERQSR